MKTVTSEVISVSPSYGPLAGGTNLTVVGYHFSQSTPIHLLIRGKQNYTADVVLLLVSPTT